MKNKTQTERVAALLSMFQTLELSLKIYISAAYKVIKHSVGPGFVFDYGYKDIENFPLEKLLSVFGKLNSNSDLKVRIGSIIKGRNELAHRALIYRHEVVVDILGIDMEKHHLSIEDLYVSLNQILLDMADEMEAMVARVPAQPSESEQLER